MKIQDMHRICARAHIREHIGMVQHCKMFHCVQKLKHVDICIHSLSLYMTVYILPCSNGYFSILFYFQLQFSFLSVGLLHKTDICKRLKEILSEIFFIAIIVRKPSEHIERPNRYYEDVSEYSRLSNQAWVVSNRLKNCQTIN